jgi:hypothetical protein
MSARGWARCPRPLSARERGDVVLGWLGRVVLALVTGGVVLFDVLSVTVARIGVADDAAAATRAASAAYASQPDVQRAYDAATEVARQHGASVATADFRVAPDGRVHLRLSRTTRTLVLTHVGRLRHLTTVTAVASGRARLS